MAFATTGRSDGRRRRVLMQSNGTSETPPASSTSSSANSEVGAKRPYHEAAQRSFQPALTSLIPRRPLTHFFLACLGLSAVLFVVDAWVVTLEHPRLLRDLLFLSPTAPGSLMDWLVQGLRVAAAATAGLIYLVRRHRVDDYRGRYRWWLWAAGCCLLASADATTHFSTQLTHVVARASGSGAFLPPSITALWPLFAGAFVGGFLARELFESKFAMTLFLASAGSMLATAVVMSGRLSIADPVLEAMAVASGRFLAVWLILSGLLWYARHVDLAAHGLLPAASATRDRNQTTEVDTSTEPVMDEESAKPRPKRLAKKKKEASLQAGDSDSEPPRRTPAASKTRKQEKVSPSTSDHLLQPEEGSEDEYRGLSKSERRRLRKQKRRAARRQAA